MSDAELITKLREAYDKAYLYEDFSDLKSAMDAVISELESFQYSHTTGEVDKLNHYYIRKTK